jgi:hypothetical protein
VACGRASAGWPADKSLKLTTQDAGVMSDFVLIEKSCRVAPVAGRASSISVAQTALWGVPAATAAPALAGHKHAPGKSAASRSWPSSSDDSSVSCCASSFVPLQQVPSSSEWCRPSLSSSSAATASSFVFVYRGIRRLAMSLQIAPAPIRPRPTTIEAVNLLLSANLVLLL